MPGMLAYALTPEEIEEVKRRRAEDAEQQAEAAREQAMREQNLREAGTSWERLKGILRGERPTRETNEDYRARTAGMLPAAPDSDPYFYARLRNKLPANSPLQAVYGPLAHGQEAEEMVRNNPMMALPLTFAIPAYTAGKATGMISARSPASLDEMIEAYKGLGRGLLGSF